LSLFQNKLVASLCLTLLGTGISLYAFLDLKDFIYHIEKTDLGKLSEWILKEFPYFPIEQTTLSYLFAIFILLFNFGIVTYYSLKILKWNPSQDEKALKKILSEYQKGNLPEDTANWFLERGLSLDGRKISKDAILNIYQDGEIDE
jgi:hypothetical protein